MENTEEVKQEGEFKVKKRKGRPKKLTPSNIETPKIDFKKEENANKESSSVELSEDKSTKSVQEIEVPESTIQQTEEKIEKQEVVSGSIEEINPEEIVEEEIKEVVESKETKLPEGVDKLVKFMHDTGGNMSDYLRLNADYSNVNEDVLLKEYYKNTKPHLDNSEIDFIMEENFKVDEDYDEDREIRRKKLAKKEAKKFLDGLKNTYYEEIKLRPTVNNELTKAKEFFDKFSQDKEVAQKQHETFKTNTQNLFSEEFKGFDFKLGEKHFRYGVSNPSEVANAQSDISNVVKKFLNDKGEVVDVKGYHKAMYAARNADTIAQHFYEQGKADAVKDVVAKSKNINNDARSTAPDDIYLNGFKLKAVSGIDSSKLKIKRNK